MTAKMMPPVEAKAAAREVAKVDYLALVVVEAREEAKVETE